MMVCATSSTIRNPAPPRPLLLSMAITAASRPARRRSSPTSVVALHRQKARLGYAGNTHRQPTQPDRGPARRLIWPAKPGQLQFVGRNGYAECADREVGGRGRRVYFVDTGGREIARRTINERIPPCRHYVRG